MGRLVELGRTYDSSMLLLTDGSVLFLPSLGIRTPSRNGSYVHGSFRSIESPMLRAEEITSAVVLRNGAVLAMLPASVALLDIRDDDLRTSFLPVSARMPADTILSPPVCVLADGRVVMTTRPAVSPSSFDPATFGTIVVDPETGEFRRADDAVVGRTPPPTTSEDYGSWLLLPDGRVLWVGFAVDEYLAARLFDPASGRWRDAGVASFPLPDLYVQGRLPAVVLPPESSSSNGRVAVVTPTAIVYYRPPSGDGDGEWSSGPPFPPRARIAAAHPIACLLPSGSVFCGVSSTFYEFSPVTEEFAVAVEGIDASSALLLPTGELLLMAHPGETLYVYRPNAAEPLEIARPRLVCPAELRAGESIVLRGRGFNGVSQAVGLPYARDWYHGGLKPRSPSATNYALVQLEWGDPSAPVKRYCRTRNHSTMGIATGELEVSTEAEIPPDVPDGLASLRVIANGVASHPCEVRVSNELSLFGRKPEEPHFFNYIIGNPNDGGFILVGPFGFKPVPPWDPNVRTLTAVLRAATNRLRVASRAGWSLLGAGALVAVSTWFEVAGPKLAMAQSITAGALIGAGAALLGVAYVFNRTSASR